MSLAYRVGQRRVVLKALIYFVNLFGSMDVVGLEGNEKKWDFQVCFFSFISCTFEFTSWIHKPVWVQVFMRNWQYLKQFRRSSFFYLKKKRSHFIKDPTGYHYPFFPFGWVSNIYYELAIFKTIWKIQVNENEIQQRLGIIEYHWSPCHVDIWPIGVQHLHKNLLEAFHSEISLVGVW